MRKALSIIAGAFFLIGVIAAGTLYTYWDQAVPIFGMGRRLAFASYRQISKFCGSEVDQVKDNTGDNDQGKTEPRT